MSAERSVDKEKLQIILDSLADLHAVQDPIHREYAIVEQAKHLDIPLDSFRQMFQDYYLQQEEAKALKSWWKAPLFRGEKNLERFSRFLDEMDIFRIIGKLASLSVVLGVITYIVEIPQRAEQKTLEQRRTQYEAWQIIRANEGQRTSGGRIEALQDLHRDGVSLAGLNVSDAYLKGINLEHANIFSSTLSKANLSEANLDFVELGNSDLTEAYLASASLKSANLVRSGFESSDLSNADLTKANLFACDLRKADLTQAKLIDVNLKKANLMGTNLETADLSRAQVAGAFYDKSTVFPENFDPAKQGLYKIVAGANLNGVDFKLAHFEGADLLDIDLTNANLAGTHLKGADLSRVRGLAPEQIKQARKWEEAKYSAEFRKKLGLPLE
jgi:BTB/POZ domain-containing protein KCTD9